VTENIFVQTIMEKQEEEKSKIRKVIELSNKSEGVVLDQRQGIVMIPIDPRGLRLICIL